MADVFISYARRDETFVRQLRDALTEGGKDVWVDKEDIGPAVEWRRDIELGIEGADIFAFVITPDALASEYCSRELEHAVSKKKRLVPLLRREPDGIPVPEELASRNYIFFRSEPEFAPGVASVLAAIDDLPEWARAHTRLLERAERWEHRDRDGSLLLRGSDLREAEHWLGEQGAHKEPQPTPLQTELILASRKAATRRQRITIGAVLVALAVSLVLAAVALLQRNEANKQRDEAVRQAHVAQSRQLASASGAQLAADPELSVLLAGRAVSVRPTAEAERALRTALARSYVEATLRGHEAWVSTAAFDPSGRRIVTASRDGRAALWDAKTGENLAWLDGHNGWVSWASFSPDGRVVATASRDGTARLWDAATGQERATLASHTDYVSRVVFSPDGSKVLTTSRDRTARLWDVSTGTSLATLAGHRKWVVNAEFTPDGDRVVTGSDDGTVRIWDVASATSLGVLRPDAGLIASLAVSPDGERIFSGSIEGPAVLWSSLEGAELVRLPIEAGFVTSAAFSRDGQVLATGSSDGTVRVWDANGELLKLLSGHTGAISDLAVSRDGSRLVTASGDGTVRVWRWSEARVLAELRGHSAWVTSAEIAPDERTVLTASQDGTARVWDATFGQSAQLPNELSVSSVSFAADGRSVLTSGLTETTLWDAQTAEPLSGVLNEGGLVNDADLSLDGTLLVTASEDGGARIYSTATRGLLTTLWGHDGRVTSASFAPDGENVLTSGDDHTARIWNIATGEDRVFEGHMGAVPTAALSSDGSQVVTSGRGDRTARIWDAATGEELRILRGHSNLVMSAAFDPTARRVVTASTDNTARIWNADTGRTRVVLVGHTDVLTAARFSPDGRFVLTASFDGTARLWDAETGEELTSFEVGIPLNDAAFDSNGLRIVTGGLGGPTTIYTCEICGSLQDLQNAADKSVTRELTAAERQEFLAGS